MSGVLRILKAEPAVILYAINAGLALAITFGLDLTKTQEAATLTIISAVLTLAAAALTRPLTVSVITGALATGLTAAGAFGLHLTSDQVGSVVSVVSLLLMHVLRANVSPAAQD
jgi:hypothetical protein